MKMREYRPEDRNACLEIIRSNTPRYFAPHEETQFAEFLKRLPGRYFVVEEETGQIVACGGYVLDKEHATAELSWGMVRRDLHKQKVGSLLLTERLQLLRVEPDAPTVILDTSQHSYGFFEKYGFVVKKITPDGFAPGLDKVHMQLTLR